MQMQCLLASSSGGLSLSDLARYLEEPLLHVKRSVVRAIDSGLLFVARGSRGEACVSNCPGVPLETRVSLRVAGLEPSKEL